MPHLLRIDFRPILIPPILSSAGRRASWEWTTRLGAEAAKPAPAHKPAHIVRPRVVHIGVSCPGREAPVLDPQSGHTICPPPQFSYSNWGHARHGIPTKSIRDGLPGS